MKYEKLKANGKTAEVIRTRTIGADFDIEHQQLFHEVCELRGIKGAALLREVMYPWLDAYKADRDALLRRSMFAREAAAKADKGNSEGGL